MKYIFIDTNILVASAIPKHKGQIIESFDKFKDVIKEKKAVILLPEIVEIEYRRVSESSYLNLKEGLRNVRKFVSNNIPFETEKKSFINSIETTLKKHEERYELIRKETEELFEKYVRKIVLNEEIFIKANLRCLKEKKPFKKRDKNLDDKKRIVIGSSWLNDSLIIESLISECQKMHGNDDKLIFCSDNTSDFAEEMSKNKYVLHKEIKKDIPVSVSFYKSIQNMLMQEFKISLSKETKDDIKAAQKSRAEVVLTGPMSSAIFATAIPVTGTFISTSGVPITGVSGSHFAYNPLYGWYDGIYDINTPFSFATSKGIKLKKGDIIVAGEEKNKEDKK